MNWTDEYKEIVEFYYWEPHHIGRAKGEKRFDNAEQMWDHVNKLEVSLNHVFNIFFSLFDINKLDSDLKLTDGYEYVSSRQLGKWQQEMGDYTQPDLFFEGKKSNLAIELKLGAKVSSDQIAKYLIFNYHISEARKPLRLVLLTPNDSLAKISNEKFVSFSDLKSALLDFVPGKSSLPYCSYEEYLKLVEGLDIQLLSFNDFYRSIRGIQPKSEIESKLLTGLAEYMQLRNLQ